VVAQGLEHIPSQGPYIIASNHQSIADIPILNAVVPPGFAFYAKKELTYVPIIGWNLKMMGCFLIDRKRPRIALKDLDESRKKVALGRALLIFPEGTRSVDGQLAPFKRGAFSVAVQTGVPVIPCVIDGSYKIINKKSLWALPGKVSVTFGAPISVDKVGKDGEKKASIALMNKTYHIIRSIIEFK
jgi:1-acyl-sn-glycerol-3-phosphate acyltransferase